MPLPLIPLITIGAGVFLVKRMSQRQVLGYTRGVPSRFLVKDIGGGACLRSDAADAWKRLCDAALADGVFVAASPGAASGFRTSEQQAELRKRLGAYGEGGYAAAVNNSPHQTGLALDVAAQNSANADFDRDAYAWLRSHGPSFGWFNVGDGFKTKEPWHFEFRPGVVSTSNVS